MKTSLVGILCALSLLSNACVCGTETFQQVQVDEALTRARGSIQGLRSESSLRLGITAEDAAIPLVFASTILEYGVEVSVALPTTEMSLTQLLDFLEEKVVTDIPGSVTDGDNFLIAHELTHVAQRRALSPMGAHHQVKESLESPALEYFLTEIATELGKARCFMNEDSGNIAELDGNPALRKIFVCTTPDDLFLRESAFAGMARTSAAIGAPKKSFSAKLRNFAKGVAQVGLGVAGARFPQEVIDLAKAVSASLYQHNESDLEFLRRQGLVTQSYVSALRKRMIHVDAMLQLLPARNEHGSGDDSALIAATIATSEALEAISAETDASLEGCDTGQTVEDCFLKSTLAKLTVQPEDQYATEIAGTTQLAAAVRGSALATPELLSDVDAMMAAMAEMNLQFLALQNAVRNESRKFQTLSNASKARHDIALNAIRNMK